MTTRFMSGTPLSRTEKDMQLIPGFRPRQSGLSVSRYTYTPADCDCRFCANKDRKKKCGQPDGCVCLRERLVAGCVPFRELLDAFAAEVAERPFVARVSRLSATAELPFCCEQHRSRFYRAWRECESPQDGAAMCAAMYLLSADTFLWGKSCMAIKPALIDFPSIQIHGVDLRGYVLFHTAKDLYRGTKHISLSELTDPELVGDETFRLIVTAFLICRFGTAIISTFKEDTEC